MVRMDKQGKAGKAMSRILILSCGTRDLLVRYFKKSSFEKVVGADCSELAPALYEADAHYLIPRMKDPGYFDAVFAICEKEKINVVLPLQEDELNLIAENRRRFEDRGILAVVSPVEVLNLCRDKYAFYKYMKGKGTAVLPTYDSISDFEKAFSDHEIEFPVFVKPVRGAGSIGAMKVTCMEVLKALFEHSEEPLLVQKLCEGREFGIDLYVDLISKRPVDFFAKEKLRMRAGETEKSVTSTDPILKEFVLRVVQNLAVAGPIDMDVFFQDGQYYLSEINPRFGGGFPHAYVSGMNTPEYIARNAAGWENESYLEIKRKKLYVLKYSDVMAIEAPLQS